MGFEITLGGFAYQVWESQTTGTQSHTEYITNRGPAQQVVELGWRKSIIQTKTIC